MAAPHHWAVGSSSASSTSPGGEAEEADEGVPELDLEPTSPEPRCASDDDLAVSAGELSDSPFNLAPGRGAVEEEPRRRSGRPRQLPVAYCNRKLLNCSIATCFENRDSI